jgi:hypothetical protein
MGSVKRTGSGWPRHVRQPWRGRKRTTAGAAAVRISSGVESISAPSRSRNRVDGDPVRGAGLERFVGRETVDRRGVGGAFGRGERARHGGADDDVEVDSSMAPRRRS